MSQKNSPALTIIAILLCGLPGMLALLCGVLSAGSGLLADKAQLKLDTNLDQASMIWTGLGGVCLGLVFVAIPIVIWLWTRRY